MSAAARIAAPVMLSRFRGALVGSVLGDCIGGEFEGAVDVPLDRVLQHLSALDDDTRGEGILQYSDDTAMMRCVAESLLTRMPFDEHDMARRFAKEFNFAPGRGYGSGVIQVLRKLASPHLKDVFQPAQVQFGGRGSFGNGGAMRAAPFALAFRSRADVCKYSRLGAMLTHSCSLGYNGAALQALAVHLSLQGALALPKEFINKLISEMEEMEKDETAQHDAKALNLSEFPYCSRLHRVKELMDRNSVSIEEVISELGNGIAALQSVPTAIFCVLHCLEPRAGLPEKFRGLERTIAYSLALGGDTDTIACMAGAIAGAHYGIDSIPQSWQKSCEGVEEADDLARRLYDLYCLPQSEEDRGTSSYENNQPHTHTSDQHTTKTD
ncbi:poly(ADP-ribose) glycohydrolase ARH3 [Labeo rohita]|uniref:ADP-ribosylhydrolase ARH3 n=2 Tax=Labeo rohita TaxID=84645 RepID=A0A498MLM8_LABRO|nr:ADP-ribosylhydrolase ARH3 [Labeo rohita]KAI2654447.1 ADP-ribose glycohydrolase ARH3 [Labeo rohita]RXN20693.1 poly(ADP-ribose) glycohydrolase ARH3 [Labeo rohita]